MNTMMGKPEDSSRVPTSFLTTRRVLTGISPLLLILFGACGGGGSDNSAAVLAQLQQQFSQQSQEMQQQYQSLLAQFNAIQNNPDCQQAVSAATGQLSSYVQQQQQQQQQQAQVGAIGAQTNSILGIAGGGLIAQPTQSTDILGLASAISSGVPQNCASTVQNALAAWSHFLNGSFSNSSSGIQFLQAEGSQILQALAGNTNIPPQVLAQIALPLLSQMGYSGTGIYSIVQNLLNSYQNGGGGLGGATSGTVLTGSFGFGSGAGLTTLAGAGNGSGNFGGTLGAGNGFTGSGINTLGASNGVNGTTVGSTNGALNLGGSGTGFGSSSGFGSGTGITTGSGVGGNGFGGGGTLAGLGNNGGGGLTLPGGTRSGGLGTGSGSGIFGGGGSSGSSSGGLGNGLSLAEEVPGGRPSTTITMRPGPKTLRQVSRKATAPGAPGAAPPNGLRTYIDKVPGEGNFTAVY
jgi:hypothetical protein